MADDAIIARLNRLLEAEYGNLIQRLGECNPLVTWPAADDRRLVDRMLADAKSHQRDLVHTILRLKGAPIPPTFPTALGGVHYLQLSHLMPQVISDIRRLITLYETPSGCGNLDVDSILSRILADHRRHQVELERLHSNLGSGRQNPVAARSG
jgi:hypothetical protein